MATKGNTAAPKAADVLGSAKIVSPLDEMDRQPAATAEKETKTTKRPVRVARRKN
jgi:hypothetical protein